MSNSGCSESHLCSCQNKWILCSWLPYPNPSQKTSWNV
jgi:hypothetical protein